MFHGNKHLFGQRIWTIATCNSIFDEVFHPLHNFICILISQLWEICWKLKWDKRYKFLNILNPKRFWNGVMTGFIKGKGPHRLNPMVKLVKHPQWPTKPNIRFDRISRYPRNPLFGCLDVCEIFQILHHISKVSKINQD